MNKLLKTHTFVVNPNDNGGEQLSITTMFFDNGDHGDTVSSQEITLQSYSNSMTFDLSGAVLTPEILRKFADELARARNMALNDLMTS